MEKILVIGATGHFGGRICRRLVGEPNTQLVVSSRTLENATALANELNLSQPLSAVQAVALNLSDESFHDDLREISPYLVIHTAGPFQGQRYSIAKACVATGSHYIDLADGREFVEGFHSLNDEAKKAGVLLVTGVSTLPGLSTAVINHYLGEFNLLETVRLVIAPAHQTPRGMGTIAAVLSYCGKPIKVLENGSQTLCYGWASLKKFTFPALGKRIAAVCDVPDLTLLPQHYPGLTTATFHAGLEAPWEQFSLWCMAWLTRLGVVRKWDKCFGLFNTMSELFLRMGSDTGGMLIHLAGTNSAGNAMQINWYLNANNNHGPEIPCTPALILARKLVQGKLPLTGAMPCVGLFSLGDFEAEVAGLQISWRVETVLTPFSR